jgi:two-component system LytT family response regulator
MTKIRTVVVDDEPVARARLVALLGDEPDIELVGESPGGRGAVTLVERTLPHLVFLDVQMPEMDGFAVARALDHTRTPAIVFVTAYEEYALQAFEIHALDYLLKPFSAERFQSALAHARAHLQQRQASTVGRHLLSLLPGQGAVSSRERLIVKSAGRIHFVRTADIDWCEAAGNYVRLHVGAVSHLMRETMMRLEAGLDPDRFVRIHRCTIVNVDRIQELRPSSSGEYHVVLRDGTELALSRGYRDGLQARLARSI